MNNTNFSRNIFWSSIWNFIKKHTIWLVRVIFVGVLVRTAWTYFLKYVANPPLPETPILIMVWISVGLILLAAFPDILKIFKKFKIGDFEMELQDAVEKASVENKLRTDEVQNRLFNTKGGYRELVDLIKAKLRSGDRSANLVVDLERNISSFVLAEYLFFLDLLGITVHVLFTTRSSSGIKLYRHSVVGAIPGNEVKNMIFIKYPDIPKKLTSKMVAPFQDDPSDFGARQLTSQEAIINSIRNIHMSEGQNDTRLMVETIEDWFADKLNSKSISRQVDVNDKKTLQKAIADGDTYLLVVENDEVTALMPICEYARAFTQKVIARESQS